MADEAGLRVEHECFVMENERLHQIVTSSEFGKLFTEYHPRFVAVACRYVRNAEVAEDIVSDCFISFWEIRNNLVGDINIPAYILTSVKNRCLNHLNAELRHRQAERNLHSTRQRLLMADIRSLSACDPDLIFSKEIQILVNKAISQMTPTTRNVFLLSREEGKTYREIADELDITVSRVNFEIRRALDLLRTELKDYLPATLIFWLFTHRF